METLLLFQLCIRLCMLINGLLFLLFNSDEEDIISSDEEVPFRDDENERAMILSMRSVFFCVFWMSRLLRPLHFCCIFCAGKFLSWGADPLLDWQRRKTRLQCKRLQRARDRDKNWGRGERRCADRCWSWGRCRATQEVSQWCYFLCLWWKHNLTPCNKMFTR